MSVLCLRDGCIFCVTFLALAYSYLFIKRVELSCSFGIVLHIGKDLTKLSSDTLAIFVYMPPVESPFYDGKTHKGNVFVRGRTYVIAM